MSIGLGWLGIVEIAGWAHRAGVVTVRGGWFLRPLLVIVSLFEFALYGLCANWYVGQYDTFGELAWAVCLAVASRFLG